MRGRRGRCCYGLAEGRMGRSKIEIQETGDVRCCPSAFPRKSNGAMGTAFELFVLHFRGIWPRFDGQ